MLLWCHSPARYSTANLPIFWSATTGAPTVDAASPPVPDENTITGAGSVLQRLLPGDGQFRIGCRCTVASLPAVPTELIAIVDSSDAALVSVVLNTDGTLALYQRDTTPSPATILRTGILEITPAVEFRLGFKGRIHPTLGSLEAHVDSTRTTESVFVRVTGVNTDPIGAGGWGGVRFNLTSDIAMRWFYACDGTGVRNADLIHGAEVRNYPPTYTPSPVYADWTTEEPTIPDAIDDSDPDGSTTVARSEFVGDRFSCHVGTDGASPATVPDAVRVLGAQLTVVATAYTPVNLAPIVVVDGGLYRGPDGTPGDGLVSPTEWRPLRALWETNPRTGSAWTGATLTAAQWGAESRG